jgi:hypothetical protein
MDPILDMDGYDVFGDIFGYITVLFAAVVALVLLLVSGTALIRERRRRERARTDAGPPREHVPAEPGKPALAGGA